MGVTTKKSMIVKDIAPINRIAVLEITEEELQQIKQRGDDSSLLSFSSFCFSEGITFFTTLLTTESNEFTQTLFTTLCVTGFITGIVLFLFWRKGEKKIQALMKAIEARGTNSNCQD